MKWMVPAVVAALARSAMANGEDTEIHLKKTICPMKSLFRYFFIEHNFQMNEFVSILKDTQYDVAINY